MIFLINSVYFFNKSASIVKMLLISRSLCLNNNEFRCIQHKLNVLFNKELIIVSLIKKKNAFNTN